MTATKAQLLDVFGKPAVWDMFAFKRPSNFIDFQIQLAGVDPVVVKALNDVISGLKKEQRTNPKRPTICLLCDANFLKRSPAFVLIMKPATRDGNGNAFVVCDDCEAKPDFQENVYNYLRRNLGAFEVQWGHA